MTGFRWSPARRAAALALADGKTRVAAAGEAGIAEKTIYRWLEDVEFASEVDRLTLMTGIALRAERLRLVKRVVNARVAQLPDSALSRADLLDLLKFAQGETDGIKLNLAALVDASAHVMATGGPDGDADEAAGEDGE